MKATSRLELALTRSRQLSRSQDFWGFLTPRPTTSPSRGISQDYDSSVQQLSSALCGYCHPLQQQGSSLHGSQEVDAGPGKFCEFEAPCPGKTQGSLCLITISTEIPRKSKRKSSPLWPGRNFKVNSLFRFFPSLLYSA